MIRGLTQILFLIVFLLLMIIGKAQLWMGFIFLSIILAAFFGRFYCGWACPINTVMRPFVWISKKLGWQRKQVPEVLKSGKIRIVVFAFFLVGLGYTIYTITQGRKFPLPLIIIPLGVITAVFINERSWHRYLCPWGVLFSITARFSKRGVIAESGCLRCSACERICPGDAIIVKEISKASIDPTHCLLCLKCKKTCPLNMLNYKNSISNDV
ncbi:4Fe-4S binding protein [Clostridium polyendosporum]|uniref:4Fe-4S binding protein n=1 Tax=Clostridium polyendosporum TaxID=69208 RepID=UPI001BB4322B|nr:4Fe-4S binding protein [Clostridium polyendosporum]